MNDLENVKAKLIYKLIKTKNEWIIRSVEKLLNANEIDESINLTNHSLSDVRVRSTINEDIIGFVPLTISNSQIEPESYVLVLEEVGGATKIPIMIDYHHAGQIAILLAETNLQRPTVYDLLKNQILYSEFSLKMIIIDSLVDNVFYSKIVLTKKDSIVEIDAQTSDAITLAMKCFMPIYISKNVVEVVGVVIESE